MSYSTQQENFTSLSSWSSSACILDWNMRFSRVSLQISLFLTYKKTKEKSWRHHLLNYKSFVSVTQKNFVDSTIHSTNILCIYAYHSHFYTRVLFCTCLRQSHFPKFSPTTLFGRSVGAICGSARIVWRIRKQSTYFNFSSYTHQDWRSKINICQQLQDNDKIFRSWFGFAEVP